MVFDELDEFENELEDKEVQTNLDLIDGLQKNELAIDELFLRQRSVDNNYFCIIQKCNSSNNRRNIPRPKEKERERAATSGMWGHGCCQNLTDSDESSKLND